jgi:Fic family protein
MKKPRSPKPLQQLLSEIQASGRLADILAAYDALPKRLDYLHWDDLRYRQPPAGLSTQEWWLAVKLQRKASFRDIPLVDTHGNAFGFCIPDFVAQQLHQIDREAGTLIGIQNPITNPQTRDRYLVRSLMEEAITSSQLEGAIATREVAKAMLSSGRKPRNRSEQMILNNYQTMQHIRELKETPLTPEIVLDIHRIISQDALDNPEGAGRLRRQNEPIEISDDEGNIFYIPPPAEQLPERLKLMCRFANGEIPDTFIHPVIRAILLHFWLAYDHPFVDGNGRTARALFYWEMLHNGYWLFEFISISQIIIKAPIQYYRAFLYTETDGNDLTYFLVHQTKVIRRALQELHNYITRKSREVEEITALLNQSNQLNYRQQALLADALKHPGHKYTVAEHQGRHGVVYQTARVDLLALAEAGLLDQRKQGKAYIFIAPIDLAKRLKNFKQ